MSVAESKREQAGDPIEETSLKVLEFIKSLGYIDRRMLEERFSLKSEELQKIFDLLEERGLLKPILLECSLKACKGCPYLDVCRTGKVKFYVLG